MGGSPKFWRGMKRSFFIVGNWKMHKTRHEASLFLKNLEEKNISLKEVFIAAPATTLDLLSGKAKEVFVGAQDVSQHHEGAFTGEISAQMLKEAGAKFSLVGHSERRLYHHEASEVVGKKLSRCLEADLFVFLCVGETLAQREQGMTQQVLSDQVAKALLDVPSDQLKQIAIAYEPVWAIGTGHAATLSLIESAHQIIKEFLISKFDKQAGSATPILYGGSVNLSVIEELTSSKYIDGVLIGGASLDPHVFANIITISRNLNR